MDQLVNDVSSSILKGDKSKWDINMEMVKIGDSILGHCRNVLKNDTKVREVIFSKDTHFDAVVTMAVGGMWMLY